MTGKLFSADVLRKLNIVELTSNGDSVLPVELIVRENLVAIVSLRRTALNLHCSKLPVVVHVNSS